MYLLDSNIFIEAKNRYYGFDLAPGFWDWLDLDARAGAIGSITAVREELTVGTDDLAVWARQRPEAFRELDELTAPKLEELAEWAVTAGHTEAAVNEFLSVADFQLVAYAAAHGHTVVTHEIAQPEARKRVLIPNACLHMRVRYCNTFDMLRARSISLVRAAG